MAGLRDHFHLESLDGETFTAGGVNVTPQARVFTLRLPCGGLVYARPTSLRVEQDGTRRRIRVVDVTRLVQLSLFFATIVMMLTIGASGHRARNRKEVGDGE